MCAGSLFKLFCVSLRSLELELNLAKDPRTGMAFLQHANTSVPSAIHWYFHMSQQT